MRGDGRYGEQRALLRALFDAVVADASPANCLPPYLPSARELHAWGVRRTIVVGAGKAAAAMARAVEDNWQGDAAALSGLVITRYGHAVPTRRIEVVEAAHPLPDAAGAAAAQRLRALLDGLKHGDLVLVLLSGGGSALLAAPMAGISLEEKRAVSARLLACGADIGEINCVRKHLSALKGGRLALACAPAQVLTLAISDVPGDDLSAIASGPTVPDPTSCEDALEIVDRYGIALPEAVRRALLLAEAETPKGHEEQFLRCENRLIATAQSSLRAAATMANRLGVRSVILGDAIQGEAREAARVLAGIALSAERHGEPVGAPCVLLSGGETTVRLQGPGRGGRNSEFLLALALAFNGDPHMHAIACDTDGIDGSEDNAGAIIDPSTLRRAAELGLEPRAMLMANDAYGFFEALDDLVVTGPTRTNINDFRAILVERRR